MDQQIFVLVWAYQLNWALIQAQFLESIHDMKYQGCHLTIYRIFRQGKKNSKQLINRRKFTGLNFESTAKLNIGQLTRATAQHFNIYNYYS